MNQTGNVGNEQRTEAFHLGYQKSLDGIRGIAILLVVLHHLDILEAQAGFVGVDIFFVLSGFLITSLLIAEWDQSNNVSFKNFYWRRVLRLLPALIAMLTVSMIYLCFTSPVKIVVKNLWYALEALFYSTNWAVITHLGERSNHLFNHTWSLSVEEQFYFIWPALLFFLLHKVGARTSLLWFILLAALLADLLRIIFLTMGVTSFWRYYCGLDTRADSLLLGCCAGVLISSNLLPRGRWLDNLFKMAAIIFVPGLICLIRRPLYDPWMYCVGWFLISLFAATIIIHVVSSKSILKSFLEISPLVYIGKISYGLYLWHYPIIYAVKSLQWPHWQYAATPIIAAFTLFSYYLIELPFLRRKRRFEKAK